MSLAVLGADRPTPWVGVFAVLLGCACWCAPQRKTRRWGGRLGWFAIHCASIALTTFAVLFAAIITGTFADASTTTSQVVFLVYAIVFGTLIPAAWARPRTGAFPMLPAAVDRVLGTLVFPAIALGLIAIPGLDGRAVGAALRLTGTGNIPAATITLDAEGRRSIAAYGIACPVVEGRDHCHLDDVRIEWRVGETLIVQLERRGSGSAPTPADGATASGYWYVELPATSRIGTRVPAAHAVSDTPSVVRNEAPNVAPHGG